MRPPSPGTYSTFGDAAPSHISVLLLAARALYAYPALQRLFTKYPALPYVACLAGGLHSPECLHALMALREACASRSLHAHAHAHAPSSSATSLFGGQAASTDAELAANRKRAFDAGLTRALQELVETAAQLAVARASTLSPLPPPATSATTTGAAVAEGEKGQQGREEAPSPSPSSAEEEQHEQEEEGAALGADEQGREEVTTEERLQPSQQPQHQQPQPQEQQRDEERQEGTASVEASRVGCGDSAGAAATAEPPTFPFPLRQAPDPLAAAVPTLRVLLDLLCSFLHSGQGVTPTHEYDALRQHLLQHCVLLFELSRHPVRARQRLSISPLRNLLVLVLTSRYMKQHNRTSSCASGPASSSRRSSWTPAPYAPWPCSTRL
jgi:hypothetical protein